MKIGIDGSRAFLPQRTGIEEYSYQVIKTLRNKLDDNQVFLYLRKNQKIDFDLPENWKIKIIKWPYFWTQAGLSLEMLFYPVDTLFIPAHTVPFLHAKNTAVTIHGLEYEFCPQAYSLWERIYMRWSIKFSCRWASSIIAVSNNTKLDLMRLYKVDGKKVQVIYEGYENCHPELVSGSNNDKMLKQVQHDRYLLFIGRLEERKNIKGIIGAFEILKEKYKIPHKLILAGKPNYGFEKIKEKIENSRYKKDILLPGFIKDEKKRQLLANADVFLFPTFYEGFGLPILEAQNAGIPVVAANNSSIPEVVNLNCHPELAMPAGRQDSGSNEKRDSGSEAGMTWISAFLVNPNNLEKIAEATHKLISDENLRKEIVEKGYQNVKRFGWEKCAEEIVKLFY